MSKKRTGGRVTPKGTQPAGTRRHESGAPAAPVRGSDDRRGQLPGRSAFGPVDAAPVRPPARQPLATQSIVGEELLALRHPHREAVALEATSRRG